MERSQVERIEKESYDIIFMDINMPIMNGIDATKILREKGIKTPNNSPNSKCTGGRIEKNI